jgi:hypothetical protein
VNLPKYVKETAEAHEKFRDEVSIAQRDFEKAVMNAVENLEVKLGGLRVEFFEDENIAAMKEDVPKRHA